MAQWVASGEYKSVVIRYGPGGHQAANLVAAFLDFGVDFVADDALFGNEVVVEYGDESPAVLAAPRALTKAAEPIELPTPPTTEVTPTTGATQIYAFDCDAPRS